MTHLRQDLTPARDPGLIAIACFKMVKAVTLIGLGLGAFRLGNPTTAGSVSNWLLHLSLPSGQELIDRALEILGSLTSRRATELGLGAIAYGTVFGVEGIGLWKGRRWAEYLTVILTALLIPLEVYELTRRLTTVRVAALAINIAAVVYLIYRLRNPRADSVRVGNAAARSARASA